MSRQRVYLMGRQAIIPKLEGAAGCTQNERQTDAERKRERKTEVVKV